MSESREPELPFDGDLEPTDFTGPRDQVGFEDLRPTDGHPLAESDEAEEADEADGADEDRDGGEAPAQQRQDAVAEQVPVAPADEPDVNSTGDDDNLPF